MEFFDKVGKKVTAGSQYAMRQTKIFADITKINGQISEKEKMIAQYYNRLGQQYFEKHATNSESEFKEIVESISKCYEEIESMKTQISLLKSTDHCEKCGAVLEEESVFCPRCGEKRQVNIIVDSEDKVCCSQCGSWMPKQQKFCTNCGQRMEIVQETILEGSAEEKSKENVPQTEERIVEFCPNCGMKVLNGTVFCPNCGIPIQE